MKPLHLVTSTLLLLGLSLPGLAQQPPEKKEEKKDAKAADDKLPHTNDPH